MHGGSRGLLTGAIAAVLLCGVGLVLARPQSVPAAPEREAPAPLARPRTVLLVRHAEKDPAGDPKDPGLSDRGRVAAGLRADLNVIDLDGLAVHAPEVRYDLPAGGRRLVQTTKGYAATVVAEAVTYRDGAATGALPGRLVRGVR